MSALTDIRDIFRGVLANFFGFGGRLIARAILMIFAGRAFGIEALGHLGQVAAISEIAAACCVMGLKRSLLDMLSADELAGRAPEKRMVEALGVAALIGAVVGGLLCFAWWQIFPEKRYLLPLLFIAVPSIVIADVSLTAIKFKRIVRWDVWARCITEPWMFVGLAFLFWTMGRVGDGLIIAYVGSVMTAALTAIFGLSHVIGLRKLASAKPSVKSWPAIVRHSLPIGITDISIMALRRLDLIVLSLFVGPAGAGLYYMAQQLVTIPQKIGGMFEPMLSPVMAGLHNRRQVGQIRNNLVSVCRWIFTAQFALTIPMIVFGESLMGLFGEGFAAGASVLAIILLAELIDGTFISSETPLVYAKPKIPPTLLVIALIVEVCAVALFASLWGVEGAAIGFLVTLFFLNTARIIMVRKHLNIAVLNTTYFKPALIGVLIAGALYALQKWGPQGGVFTAIYIISGLLAFGWLIKTFAMTRSDKVLWKTLTRRRKKMRPAS